jgi:hypothetical protein
MTQPTITETVINNRHRAQARQRALRQLALRHTVEYRELYQYYKSAFVKEVAK